MTAFLLVARLTPFVLLGVAAHHRVERHRLAVAAGRRPADPQFERAWRHLYVAAAGALLAATLLAVLLAAGAPRWVVYPAVGVTGAGVLGVCVAGVRFGFAGQLPRRRRRKEKRRRPTSR